jgi:3-oxoacyl-[acyl-carrier-protein] synthase II
MESSAHASRRGATVYGRLLAADVATESFAGATPNPTGDGVTHAVRKVMAALDLADIGWIKGHGTGTLKGDAAECAGLQCALGQRFSDIPITSLKSTLGHSLGASGMVECIGALLAARRGFMPATAGTRTADPALHIDLVTETRRIEGGGVILMLSESFGGRCVALALSA